MAPGPTPGHEPGAPRGPAAAVVTDPSDGRLDPYRRLSDQRHRRRVEADLGIFVAEGILALGQLVASSYEVRSVLVAEARLPAVADLITGLRAPVLTARPEVIAAAVGFDLHRGVLAVGLRRPPATVAEVVGSPGPLLVVEGVNDHENLGALFRTARALGAAGVLLDPTCADPLYRRSIRVSLGHVLRLPWARLEAWPGGLEALARSGRATVALTPGGDDLEAALGGLAPGVGVAVVVGAEGPGLSPSALAAADIRARIPMAAGVDSLNVATAAGIALHRLVPIVQP